MALIQSGGNTSGVANVDDKSLRVDVVRRGAHYAAGASSGTVAAALAANSALWLIRHNLASGFDIWVDRLRVEFTTLAAFTTPVVAGRRLGVYRAAGATASSGGTQVVPVSKSSNFGTSTAADVRVATTGALTVTGGVFEATALAEMTLAHVGAAGGYREAVWELAASECHPIVLTAGQTLAVRNPVAMDAAGTFQVSVTANWMEVPA